MDSLKQFKEDIANLKTAIGQVKRNLDEDYGPKLAEVYERLFVTGGKQRPVLQQLDELEDVCTRIETSVSFNKGMMTDLNEKIQDIFIRPEILKRENNSKGYRKLIFNILERFVLIALGALTGWSML